ncbi:unnamed protein product [Symbiodinium microadriaticum]|nr:unnamed protein product [Symbiodinium microadriaticum]
MICVLSPAKTMRSATDLKAYPPICQSSVPTLVDKAIPLAKILKKKSRKELKTLCDISDNLSAHVESVYKDFVLDNGSDSSRFSQAALSFNGPAFQGLNAESLLPRQGELLQKHLRILTGLYGSVRPGDLIQEHRLCMSTKLATDSTHNDLYEYWGDTIAMEIITDLETQADALANTTGHRPAPLIVNCASQEYYKAVGPYLTASGVQVVDCVFLDGGMVKSAFAKRARGLMARYVCTNGGISSAADVDVIKDFCAEGYVFSATQSTPCRLVFIRTTPPSATKKKNVTTPLTMEGGCSDKNMIKTNTTEKLERKRPARGGVVVEAHISAIKDGAKRRRAL